MQNIQDKEFDQLFKDKFEMAEIVPSADLWSSIAGELQPAPKRKFPVYWMAAALVLVVVGLGLLMPATEKIRLHAPVKLAERTNDATISRSLSSVTIDDTAVVTKYESTPLVIAPRLRPATKNSIVLKVVQPEQVNDRLLHKPVEAVQELVQVPAALAAVANEPMIASINTQEYNNAEILVPKTEETTNKGIRNVGDLINFVVDKVDKREKKVIQFDTDEDNSSIVAFNIGFIKLNRKSAK